MARAVKNLSSTCDITGAAVAAFDHVLWSWLPNTTILYFSLLGQFRESYFIVAIAIDSRALLPLLSCLNWSSVKKKNSMIILSTSVRILLRDPLDRSHYLALLHQDPIHCIEHISKQGISVTLFILPLRGTVLPHRTMFPSLCGTVLPSAYGVHQAFFCVD